MVSSEPTTLQTPRIQLRFDIEKVFSTINQWFEKKLWTALCGRLVATVFGHCGRHLYLTLQGTAVVAANQTPLVVDPIGFARLLQNRLELGQNSATRGWKLFSLKSLLLIAVRPSKSF